MTRIYSDFFRRKPLRMANHEYNRTNIYFITIRTHEREKLFGLLDYEGLHINAQGLMIIREWVALENRFDNVSTGVIMVMPDHIHGIIQINGTDNGQQQYGQRQDTNGQRQALRPTLNSEIESNNIGLPRVIQAFKSITTQNYISGVRQLGWPEFNGKIWHRNYNDRIIRDQVELDAIVEYIRQNPQRLWQNVYNDCKRNHDVE